MYEYKTGNGQIVAEGERLIRFPIYNGIVYIDMPYAYEGQTAKFYPYGFTDGSRIMFMERDAALDCTMVTANGDSFFYLDHGNVLRKVDLKSGGAFVALYQSGIDGSLCWLFACSSY